MSILRKLTTRPVWKWERLRPYPIRDRCHRLPAIPARGEHLFVVLATVASFSDALWTAWSWLRFLAPHVRLELVLDGEITSAHHEALARISPGASLVAGREIVAATRNWPAALSEFIERHPLGRKLGLILLGQQKGTIFYCDSDVLAFHEPLELIDALHTPGASRYMHEIHEGAFDDEILQAAAARGLSPRPGLNSGLALLAHNAFDLNRVEELLAGRPVSSSWFTEQTLLAVLMPPDAVALPSDRYVVSNARQFYWEADIDYEKIVARHFTGPTRHVMYSKGLPRLTREARQLNAS